jgi:hypothetical protein
MTGSTSKVAALRLDPGSVIMSPSGPAELIDHVRRMLRSEPAKEHGCDRFNALDA